MSQSGGPCALILRVSSMVTTIAPISPVAESIGTRIVDAAPPGRMAVTVDVRFIDPT